MNQENPVTLEDFQEALTPKNVLSMQIIHGALGLGVFTFFVVVVVMQFLHSAEEGVSEDVTILNIMSLAHLVMAMVCFIASKIVHDLMINASKRASFSHTGERCFATLRMASIVRLALMEGAAFFGLVICLLAAMEGQLENFPVYWLNALSCFAMIAFILANFPTKARLEQSFQDKFQNKGY